MPRRFPLPLLFSAALLLGPASAQAILSQPAALVNSGPVRVRVDVEIGEGSKLLPATAVQSHVEDRLRGAGVLVQADSRDQDLPSVVAPAERQAAEIKVSLAARRIGEPPGYIISLEISHVQPAVLQRMHAVAIAGLDWQESWAFTASDGADVLAATNTALDSLIDDFAKDYQAANAAAPRQ